MTRILPLALLPLLAACAAPPATGITDPHEGLNRRVHALNLAIDRQVSGLTGGSDAAPSGKVTVKDELFITAGNVTSNLSLPGKVVNHLLQGRPEPAVKNTFRFLINSTLGVGGLFDPAAQSFALPETDTDFGETLHVWGVGEGAFLMLPVLGPTTERDLVGRVVDFAIDPVGNWIQEPRDKNALRALKVIAKVGERGQFGGTVNSILHQSADSYAQLRLIYLQKRRHELGQTNQDDAYDPYDDN
ncbi:VacJ family lipoprotein [Paracoccus sp. p4-l81]|uniref:MlaA family lipoprotein n=1 Tax=unclassified Paracoccus (in: a-proteobacteria) TaxID=2688777 RepID=UPI0035BB14F9